MPGDISMIVGRPPFLAALGRSWRSRRRSCAPPLGSARGGELGEISSDVLAERRWRRRRRRRPRRRPGSRRARRCTAGPRRATSSNADRSRARVTCVPSACGMVSTRPAGMPARLQRLFPVRAPSGDKAASSQRLELARCCLRASRSAKRGSVTRSGRPTSWHSASNCSCLLAAMLSRPRRSGRCRTARPSCSGCPSAAARHRRSDSSRRSSPSPTACIQHRHVDERAFAGRRPAKQRRGDGERGGQPAHRVADRDSRRAAVPSPACR